MTRFDFGYDRVTKSIDESLERLGVDYIDTIQGGLWLDRPLCSAWHYRRRAATRLCSFARHLIAATAVHDPEFAPSLALIQKETLPALRDAMAKGKVKSIGELATPWLRRLPSTGGADGTKDAHLLHADAMSRVQALPGTRCK